ncbi:MAG: winged helix-turn-helix domain-containing protein [Alphaproteobacteria bacterium]|nr:winged helix-turn-helix domain-containing protein [Alphaproteobacteria bacterium]
MPLVLEPSLEVPLRAWGLHVVTEGRPAEHELVAMGDDWARLRAWRLGGHGFRVLALAAEPPEDRALLEPLAVVATPTEAAVGEALAALASGRRAGELALRGGTVDLERRVLRHAGGTTSLSRLEVSLLAYLAARPGREVPREELLRQVWGHKATVRTRAVDMAVLRLRRKVDLDGAESHLLSSYAGGYQLVLPDPEDADLVGRGPLLAELLLRLRTGARDLGLHGLPGVGKSRLARAVADRLAASGRRVATVDLEGVGSAAEARERVATTLGLSPGRAGELDLGASEVEVLVLDGADGFDPGPLIASWHAASPTLQVLGTRQVRRAEPGAVAVLVPPLDDEAARALFARRAGDRPDDGLLADLDGLPLAIELFAARTRLWSGAVQGAFGLGPVVGALDRVWGGVGEPARRLLAGLAAVRSPLDPEVVAAVAGSLAAAEAPLAELVDAGLVAVADDRVRLPGAVRAWAADRIAPEERQRLDAWLRSLVEVGEEPERAEVLRTLEARLPDLRELAGRLEGDDRARCVLAADHAARSVATLTDRLAAFDRALDPPPPDPVLEARLRIGRARVDLLERPIELLGADLERAAALASGAGRPDLAAEALTCWSQAAHHARWGSGTGARQLAERALATHPVPRAVVWLEAIRSREERRMDVEAVRGALAEAARGGRWRELFELVVPAAGALLAIGEVAAAAEARELGRRAAEALGDPGRRATVDVLHAQDLGFGGRIAACAALLEQALPVLRARRIDAVLGRARSLLLTARCHLGRHALAEELCDALITERTVAGDREGRRELQLVRCLLLMEQGRWEAATRLVDELDAPDAAVSSTFAANVVVLRSLLALRRDGAAVRVDELRSTLQDPPDPRNARRLDAIRAVAAAGEGQDPGPWLEGAVTDDPEATSLEEIARALRTGDREPLRPMVELRDPAPMVTRILARRLLEG